MQLIKNEIRVPPKFSGGGVYTLEKWRRQSLRAEFADDIKRFAARLDFAPSARGWCYICEVHGGLAKSDFPRIEKLITRLRKSQQLPLDIVAVDDSRSFDAEEDIRDQTADDFIQDQLTVLREAPDYLFNESFWESQPCYVQMVVEKIDLKTLFLPLCEQYHIRIANARGQPDMHLRKNLMENFEYWEGKGKRPILLYCGDLDPSGVEITNGLPKNMRSMGKAVGWSPQNLIVDRFGLEADFIDANGLSWTHNLMSGGGVDLATKRNKQGKRPPYVERYIAEHGVKKCEANALVTSPTAGRQLCKDAIEKYIDQTAAECYAERMQEQQQEAREILDTLLP